MLRTARKLFDGEIFAKEDVETANQTVSVKSKSLKKERLSADE
ncbi:4-oxalomesaconate tautomerase [hydrothermal vent metagenome]|uniref:4-oxalomesaconate tautomerase n=1 Tax=hydrothermal vent metagenome TaxID=652676 RepID=A0A3B0U8A2_9ZZZZ